LKIITLNKTYDCKNHNLLLVTAYVLQQSKSQ